MIFDTPGTLSGNAANVYGTLTNNTVNPMSLSLFNLYGGTLNGTGGFSNASTWTGYGSIAAPLSNTGTATFTGGTSNVSGTVSNNPTGVINVQTNPATFGTVNNSGTVQVANAAVTYGNFTNNGIYSSDPGAIQTFTNLTVGTTGYLTAVSETKPVPGQLYQQQHPKYQLEHEPRGIGLRWESWHRPRLLSGGGGSGPEPGRICGWLRFD